MSHLRRLGQTFFSFWSVPILAAMAALIVYVVFARQAGSIFRATAQGFYPYLADAFLHGQMNLRILPPSLHDLVAYKGNYYLYWPPFPAILMMPLVAIKGVQMSDVLFVLLMATVDVGIVALLLSQLNKTGLVELDASRRGLLVLFFALGSVLLPLALAGKVWATGQLTGFFFVGLAYLACISFSGWPAFLLTGLALSAAAATRNNLVFAGIWPAYYLLTVHWKEGWKKLSGYVLLAVVPVVLTVAALAWYNWARFGSPTNVGLDYHNMAEIFKADYAKYGAFNLHYVPINFYYQFIYYPFPWTINSYMGGSLFLMSPVLIGVGWGLVKGRPKLSTLALLLSILITSVPILLLMGTGWVQVGPRYTLDFTIPLIMLTALGIKRWPVWVTGLLVLIGIVQFFVGTYIYMRSMA